MPLTEIIDYDKDYLTPTSFPFINTEGSNYEMTITFNPQLYTRQSAEVEVDNVIDYIKNIFDISGVEYIHIVKEYTKSNIPHLHLHINTDSSLTPTFRANVIKAIQRQFGRASFKDVINIEAYESYMNKSLLDNTIKRGTRHYWILEKK